MNCEKSTTRFDPYKLICAGTTFSKDTGNNAAVQYCQSIASLQGMVAKLHARGINAIGSTLISNVGQGGTSAATYTAHNDINQFILAVYWQQRALEDADFVRSDPTARDRVELYRSQTPYRQ